MSGAQTRIQPLIGYNFTVKIENKLNGVNRPLVGDNYFRKISGISGSRNTNTIQAGGGNGISYHLPTEINYSPLVLERGIVAGSSPLTLWCFDSMTMNSGGIKTGIVIVYLNDQENSRPLMSWAFYNAYPTKWSISDFDAMDSKYSFESIELSYSNYTRIT